MTLNLLAKAIPKFQAVVVSRKHVPCRSVDHVIGHIINFKMAAPMVRRFASINVNKTAFFLCDMQERFRPAIQYFDEITQIAVRLVATSKILGIPLIVTEQYPKGLLHTVTELDIGHAAGVFPKTKFSMVIPEVENKMRELFLGQPETVVLFGIEAHVCVQQTALDLVSRGVDVYVIADATSSRYQADRIYAFERLRHAGVCITTSESLMFQLLADKDHDKFKEVQALVKGAPPDTGLMNKL